MTRLPHLLGLIIAPGSTSAIILAEMRLLCCASGGIGIFGVVEG
jgi:hypothetical protein